MQNMLIYIINTHVYLSYYKTVLIQFNQPNQETFSQKLFKNKSHKYSSGSTHQFFMSTKLFMVWDDQAVKQHGMYTLVKDGPLHISANTYMSV